MIKTISSVYLAPMAGVTDYAFRTTARKFGEIATVSEMVSAKALCYNDKKTKSLLKSSDTPFAVQIFGHEPKIMAEGAKIALEISGADTVDINMGCPTPKIVNNGDGSALLKDLDLAVRIVEAVCNSVPVPVTVKTRLGWTCGRETGGRQTCGRQTGETGGKQTAFTLVKRLENTGVFAVTIHGRTKTQGYSGNADWDEIKRIVENTNIPIIANGDIFTPRIAERCLNYTHAAGVMLGRGCLGQPWLCGETLAYLEGREFILPDIFDTACEQYELMLLDKDEKIATLQMRKHLAWYIRGFENNAKLRQLVMQMNTKDDVFNTIEYLTSLGVERSQYEDYKTM